MSLQVLKAVPSPTKISAGGKERVLFLACEKDKADENGNLFCSETVFNGILIYIPDSLLIKMQDLETGKYYVRPTEDTIAYVKVRKLLLE